ncbi:hemerythrin domain-containing protein [Streptomyces bambusae]|uniref:hemerythrin domain-containing protein n=1 Tax=Streptomyces bambusae TaxID=1550616 RepID=UPI001CFECBDA|nr:hemerythrin domain-containing protein [Streptomyces bambusae]MCB5164261.1 hemerythrin domain-containing protein [Streptomyces bambusae]
MGHGGDVIAELTADHDEVREFLRQIRRTAAGDERRTLADKMTIELVRHSVAEEEYLYPAVRDHIDGGDAVADKEIADHARVEQLLKELQDLDSSGAGFADTMNAVEAEVLAHLREEEGTLFPALRRACPQEDLEDLGDRIRRAKKTAPTRPHPGLPSEPPANKLLAPGLGLVDRVRDMITGRGDDSGDRDDSSGPGRPEAA